MGCQSHNEDKERRANEALLRSVMPIIYDLMGQYIDASIRRQSARKEAEDHPGQSVSRELEETPLVIGRRLSTLMAETERFLLAGLGGALPQKQANTTTNKAKYLEILHFDLEKMKKAGVYAPADMELLPFDCAVHNAVFSLYHAGNWNITEKMIFQILAGNRDNAKTPPAVEARISESLRKLMSTKIAVSISGKLTSGESGESSYVMPFLPCHKRENAITLNGRSVSGCLHPLPDLNIFTMLQDVGLASKVPVDLLNIPKLNDSAENIALKFYLLEAITKRSGQVTITYSTLYKRLGVDGESKSRKHSLRRRIRETILRFWAEKNFISPDFEESEDHRYVKIFLRNCAKNQN